MSVLRVRQTSRKQASAQNRPRFRLTAPTARQLEQARSPTETAMQCAYVAWLRAMARTVPELARGFHVPNGELRDARTAAKLARMGVRAGVLDVGFCVARGGFHGLWIELKSFAGVLSIEQQREIEQLRADGYCAEVFRDWGGAADFTRDYMQGKVVRT